MMANTGKCRLLAGACLMCLCLNIGSIGTGETTKREAALGKEVSQNRCN